MEERNNRVLKNLDRYIGCPLLFLLSRLRKKKMLNASSAPKRIAMIKTAGIGDTVLVDAMVKEVKRQYPESQITLICSTSNARMGEIIENVKRVFIFQMSNPLNSLIKLKKLDDFDLLFDFAPWTRINGVISYVLNAGYKVGFRRDGMYRHYIYDHAVEHLDIVHEIDNYRNILKAGGMHIYGFFPAFKKEDICRFTKKYVVFHLYPGGSTQEQRMWAEDKWVKLGRKISEQFAFKILISGGKENQKEALLLTRKMKDDGISCQSIAGEISLKEMCTVLAQAEILITVNTGIMHIGAAVGANIIALHGATSETRWGPLSDKAIVIKSGESCQPCISLGFESKCEDAVCMRNISVDMVMDAVNEMRRNPKRLR